MKSLIFCKCGCGNKTTLHRGVPREYYHGHNKRKKHIKENYIVDANGCWLWQGNTNHKGYALARDGHKTCVVHIYMYVDKYGPVPQGKELHHKCRVKKCINPDHVIPVTRLEHEALEKILRATL